MFLSEKLEGFAKFARTIFYIFIATFPFILYIGFIFTGTSTRSTNLILMIDVLAVAFAFVLFKKDLKFGFLKSPITLSLLVLLLTMFLSSIFGISFATSFWSKVTRMSGLYYFIHIGFFFLLLLGLFKDSVHMRKLTKVIIISSAIFSLASLLGRDGFGMIFVNKSWNGFTFGNSSFAAMYLYGAFMLAIYYLFTAKKDSINKWEYSIPFFIFLNPYFVNVDLFLKKDKFTSLLGLVGGAKASSYALIVSFLLLVSIFFISKIKSVKVRRGFIWRGTIAGVLAIGFAIYSLISPNGFIQKTYLKEASGARPLIWSLSEKAISERPFLGYGVDNFQDVYEKHYDNRVMEKVNGGEAWFDRAHNVFIDQTVETGYFGTLIYVLVYLSIISAMLYVLLKSKNKDNQVLAVIVLVYLLGHVMELQTAFDTTISYVILAVIAGFASIIFSKTYAELNPEKEVIFLNSGLKYSFAVATILLFGGLFFVGTFPIFRAEISNGAVRRVGYSEARIPLYKTLFNSPVDKMGFLNRTVADLEKGISINPTLLEDPKKIEGFTKEFGELTKEYENYVSENPNDYRAKINLSQLYIYQKLFDVDYLNQAIATADQAIKIVPNAPQAYWEKAVAYLYQRKFDLARDAAKKGLDLNPNIEESQNLVKYINESIKTFPEINFYNFTML